MRTLFTIFLVFLVASVGFAESPSNSTPIYPPLSEFLIGNWNCNLTVVDSDAPVDTFILVFSRANRLDSIDEGRDVKAAWEAKGKRLTIVFDNPSKLYSSSVSPVVTHVYSVVILSNNHVELHMLSSTDAFGGVDRIIIDCRRK
jgi:hypothetical protein